MTSIGSLIGGSENLTSIFGYWPSFHDAEVMELHFLRGDVRPDRGVYEFPVLTLRIHVWQLTKNVDSKGYMVLQHHTLTTLKFTDVSEFKMQGFNHQNALMGLVVKSQQRTKGPSPYFVVELEPAFGMGGSFECLGIEVVDSVPCTDDGRPLPAAPNENP